ncbi:TadE/TadG family type IV pilus assembly protein [Sphingomonas sp. ACRSK]|uniref:TadE/TadG family type IV pilus assembly protein n=1 Tax=Sphingomonas sp. ACRSK TaxID=2918213 RepID=UPI001EF40F25|nr:pilus assembly protein [Sphingomonas sp. ACRSK]MCG7348978.1 pilus assembly protein [Sphingomonas sp. ACRSK]
MIGRALPFLARLAREHRAVALTEFAIGLPVFLVLTLTGAELTNFIITRMRISQVALQLADNAARMGSGSLLSAKTISETDINDLLTGAGLQAGRLDLYKNGRVIVSDLEPVANPNTTSKYKIVWQRCRGSATRASSYGKAGDTGLSGMGPAGRQAFAPDGGATMFVEVYYKYQPLVRTSLAPSSAITEIASMMVRDRRDLSSIYNAERAAVSSC